MMDRLEKNSGNTVCAESLSGFLRVVFILQCPVFGQVLSERDAQLLLKDGKDLVIAVYDYWLNKRLRVVSDVCGGGLLVH